MHLLPHIHALRVNWQPTLCDLLQAHRLGPKERMREITQAQFDDILLAAKKYQKRAYESGEPQRQMAAFLAARKK